MRHFGGFRRFAILIALTLVTCATLSAETSADPVEALGLRLFAPGVEAPDFELEFLDGERRTLSSFRGDVVFLNFWATWCPPCREEMPSMQALHERLGESGLSILAVNLQEPKTSVQKFIDEYELSFYVPLDIDGREGVNYGVRSIPHMHVSWYEPRIL